MKKVLAFAILSVLCLTGCDSIKKEMEKQHEIALKDSNKKDLETIKLQYVCDERGYMYYKQSVYMGMIHLPLFINGVNGAYQVKCDKSVVGQ